ncbi:uncharacterized protein PAC_12341 [Phialocephala subalpina]|uniref:Uncharacterized protein n=1 Tax=Phialocephala subalpina TaxID=576137 RepID=A0A1L7XBN6_9HELO|nr:uncharacterized protein PAC_12341 [Phialocephala subalpina]
MQTPLFLLALAALATARTDLSGCTSSATVAYGGASLIWYVPGTGELCDFLDCGGGRAPPKTTVPGCPLYSGTATYSPSYLAGYNGGVAASTSASAVASTTQSSAQITGTAASSQQTILTGSVITSSDVSSSGSASSAVFITSTTDTKTASESQSTATSISSSGTQTSSRSSSTSTSFAAASSVTGNSGAKMNVHVWHGFVGAGAAGLTFLL